MENKNKEKLLEKPDKECFLCHKSIPEGDLLWGDLGEPYHTACLEHIEKKEMVALPASFVDAIRTYHMNPRFENESDCITFLARLGMDKKEHFDMIEAWTKREFAMIRKELKEMKVLVQSRNTP